MELFYSFDFEGGFLAKNKTQWYHAITSMHATPCSHSHSQLKRFFYLTSSS